MTGQEVVLPPTPVAVGPDGQPAGPLPPEGSYARGNIEQQQAATAQHAQEMAYQQAHVTPPNQQAPVQPPPQEPPESQRTQERISSLISQLRQKDADHAALAQRQTELTSQLETQQQALTARDEQMQAFMSDHLEELDPETRAGVLNEARTREAMAQVEQRIMQTVSPQLQALQTRNQQLEKVHLSDTHQGYNPLVHDQLIDEFRRANPACSIEQAFRAVATPEELSTGGGRPAG